MADRPLQRQAAPIVRETTRVGGPGLKVLHTSLDLRTATARGCTGSRNTSRVGRGNHGRLWPTHRTSVKLHRSCVRRIGLADQDLGFFTPAWICVLHQREAAPTRLRAGWAEGLTAANGMPGNYGRLWPTHRTSAKLHRSCVRRSGWRYQGLGFFTPAWICVLHQHKAAPRVVRKTNESGRQRESRPLVANPGIYGRLWPVPFRTSRQAAPSIVRKHE